MKSNAWNDAVNETFITHAAQILANAMADGTNQHDYIEQLAALYESMIAELPAPNDEDEE